MDIKSEDADPELMSEIERRCCRAVRIKCSVVVTDFAAVCVKYGHQQFCCAPHQAQYDDERF